MRKIHAILIALAVAAAFALAPIADAKGPRAGTASGRASAFADHGTFDHVPAEKGAKGLENAEKAKLFGKMTYASGNASCRFVTFAFDESTGTISRFTHKVWNETLFDSITVSAWAKSDTPSVHGASFRATGGEDFVNAHCNPTAATHIAGGANATDFALKLAPTEKIDANRTKGRGFVVTDATGKFHAHVILLGNGTSSNVTGMGGSITWHATNGGVLILAHPAKDTAMSQALHGLTKAASTSAERVGTVLNVADADGTPVEDEIPLGAHAETTHLEKGKVEVKVSSDTANGKLVILNFPTTTLPQVAIDKLTVKFSGAAIGVDDLTTKASDDAGAAVAALATAGVAHATVVFAANGTQITVFVPHFSDQTVSVEEAGAPAAGTPTPTGGSQPTPTPTKTPGFEAALALAAVAVAIAVRRR